jgi:hypothetical protein
VNKGDLVQVKPGCGDQGKIGILMHDVLGAFIHCIVLFPDGVQEINSYWLEPPWDRATCDDGGMMYAPPKEA